MPFISSADCCRRLAIDPKTFRRWVKQAQLELSPHPSDGRSKGLSLEHLQQLAAAHQRTLAPGQGEPPAQSAKSLAQGTRESPPPSAQACLELLGALTALCAQLAALHEQLAPLMAQLGQQGLQTEATCGPQAAERGEPDPVGGSTELSPASAERESLAKPEPAEPPRHPPPVLPLVEYGSEGHYVVICPKEGRLNLQPDSPEWFAWLETRSSFRFVGQAGRFTAHREVSRLPTAVWRAHRKIRNHTYNQRLAHTQDLTTSVLEQAAATLQAHLK
jgi:hypothetical protein